MNPISIFICLALIIVGSCQWNVGRSMLGGGLMGGAPQMMMSNSGSTLNGGSPTASNPPGGIWGRRVMMGNMNPYMGMMYGRRR